jgi:methionyl-tRNA formyltransferase
MTRAVVFAYHNVGVRCLRVLLAHGVEIPLVVTHLRRSGREPLVRSVADVAAECGIPTR